jgi:hypothetical protein
VASDQRYIDADINVGDNDESPFSRPLRCEVTSQMQDYRPSAGLPGLNGEPPPAHNIFCWDDLSRPESPDPHGDSRAHNHVNSGFEVEPCRT